MRAPRPPSPSATPASGDRDGTAIRIAIGDTQLTGRLAENATARENFFRLARHVWPRHLRAVEEELHGR